MIHRVYETSSNFLAATGSPVAWTTNGYVPAGRTVILPSTRAILPDALSAIQSDDWTGNGRFGSVPAVPVVETPIDRKVGPGVGEAMATGDAVSVGCASVGSAVRTPGMSIAPGLPLPPGSRAIHWLPCAGGSLGGAADPTGLEATSTARTATATITTVGVLRVSRRPREALGRAPFGSPMNPPYL